MEGSDELMTKKQQRFCDEYLVDCNATQAAIRAGYSKATAKSIGQRLLTNVDLQKYIQEKMQDMQDKTVATAEEVIQYLTSVLRGQSSAEIVVVEGTGDGCSEARTVQKAPDEKERLKAAELLGKRYGIFTDKMSLDGAIPVIISGEENLPE